MSVVHAEPHTVELDAARQFDFWLGEWDCTWVHDGDRCTATNSVYADLGGCVLVENFDGRPRWTCRASASRSTTGPLRWKQTWVDSQGGYLDFAGGFENGAMELRRNGEVDGTPAIFRMRWENIEANSFDWRWQRSVDGGETWTSLWELEYRRVL